MLVMGVAVVSSAEFDELRISFVASAKGALVVNSFQVDVGTPADTEVSLVAEGASTVRRARFSAPCIEGAISPAEEIVGIGKSLAFLLLLVTRFLRLCLFSIILRN
jgi:hypothetical protein